MTIALAIQTDLSHFMFSVTFPAYRPSILIWVIAALVLAVLGLAIDIVLFPATIGMVSLWFASVASGIVCGLVALEMRNL